MDLVKLKTELNNAAYAALDDVQAAVAINKPDKSQDAVAIDTGILRGCITAADWATLDADKKARLNYLFGSNTLDMPPHIRAELRGLFDTGASRNALIAATKRTGSRADELGLGRVTESDVADARRLP